MTRILSCAALFGIVAVAACGGTGEVVVHAQLQSEGAAEATPLAELEIRALPYDRDLAVDSLKAAAQAAGNPEPAIPDSVQQMQTDIAAAQEDYTAANAQWASARDSLRVIKDKLDRLNRGSGEYRLLYNDFGDQETRANAAERRANASFARFDDLQKRFAALSEELKIVRNDWGDRAYASIDSVLALKQEASGREAAADTTDANGGVVFVLKTGTWWIHARYALPFEELYWNVQIDVAKGEVKDLVLNRENAQRRPLF
jgi:hypothetical protein